MDGVLQLAHRVLDRATRAGGDIEAYVAHRVVTTVQAGTGGSVRHVGRAETRGVGVRYIVGDHVGYASTADVNDAGLEIVVARARANAEVSDADPVGAQLPLPDTAEPIDGLCLTQLTGLPLAARLTHVTELARRVASLDPRVRRLDTAQWRDEHRHVAVASTRGLSTTYESAFAELWSDALGEDEHGDATDYGYWWGRTPNTIDIEALAAETVSRTVRLLGPAASVRAVDSVIFDPDVAGLLVAAVGRSLTGGALANRRSPFAGRLGELVAADCVSLADDGRCTAGPGAAPVDGEGVRQRHTALITAGVLVGALHSTATVASLGHGHPTGNARRGSHKAVPRVAPTLLQLTASEGGFPVAGDAAYVQQISGGGAGVSSVTGRVNVGGIGFLMRDGEPAGRLPTMPVATTLQGLLSEVASVGDDARVIPEQPVLARSLVWQPPRRITW